jgi:beta-galactosidase GanA
VVLGGRSFAVQDDNFLLDGEPFRILSGSFHYHRCHESYWSDRLKRIRAMGLNTIQTYVPWNWHDVTNSSSSSPQYAWDGSRNISAFLTAAQDEGLYVLIRPGPYICGEHDFGGFPSYLLTVPDIELRTNNSA